MNGATAQIFIHENTPHVCSMFDFPKIKVFTEACTEIRQFIRNIDEGAQIVMKAERVHWDGSRDEIAEEEYIHRNGTRSGNSPIEKTNQSYVKG
jgi:hypothetical protein